MNNTKNNSLIKILSDKYQVEPEKLLASLKATSFRSKKEITNEQMLMMLSVANQYDLNPFTREIYAFPDKQGGVVPVVSIDGWNRIAQSNIAYDGLELTYSDEEVIPEGCRGIKCPKWIEVKLYRKDRSHPTVIREYLDECYRFIKGMYTPWQSHPKRMLRHKSIIQAYRLAFGVGGIYDEDEANRIIDAQSSGETTVISAKSTQPDIRAKLTEEPVEEVVKLSDLSECKFHIDELVDRVKVSHRWNNARKYFSINFEGEALEYANAELEKCFEKEVSTATDEEVS